MDDRIRYFRSEKNNGAAWNFNNVLKKSSGEFFKWASHDDMHAPDFLSKCVNVLEKDQSIVLCYSKNALIDDYGNVVRPFDLGNVADSQKPHERFRDLLARKAFPWLIFGVFRRKILLSTPLYGDYIGSDWNLLAEISLMGRICEIPEALFFRREAPESYTRRFYSKDKAIVNRRTELGWWTGNKDPPLLVLPIWKNCVEFFKSVSRVQIGFFDKLLCYGEILNWIRKSGWYLMRKDLTNEFQLWRYRLSQKG